MSTRVRTDAAAIARFALAGLGSVALLGTLILFAVSRISTSEALDAAEERARLAGYGIIEPALSNISTPPTETELAELDALVSARVLSERVVRVKLWSPDAQVIYSDEPQLIGAQFAPKDDHQTVLTTGETEAELADLDSPENRFERTSGDLLEVYLPIRLTNGNQLVYEQYERYDSITGNSRRLLRRLAIPLVVGLLALWLTQFPLARSLTRRVRLADNQRAALLQHAATASQRERERIAADLHDGVVQDLAGLTFELDAAAASESSAVTQQAFIRSANVSRTAMRRLRAALLDLQPTNVQALGLDDSIAELVEPLRRDGIEVVTNVVAGNNAVQAGDIITIYRTARELLRNVHEHSQATIVNVDITERNQMVEVTVIDNGRGFDPDELTRKRAEGHMGLELHEALLQHIGGSLTLTSATDGGTTAVARIPLGASPS